MYDVPKEYRAAIRSPTRSDRMAGKLTLTDGSTIELTDSAVISGSVSVDNQCVSGQELAFGSVYMGQASLQLRTALSSAAFYDAALQIDYEIQLADGSWYTLPVGRYTVAEAERSAAVVSLTGYDNMLKLERKFSGSAILGNAYTMLTQIAGTCGVELAQSEAEIKALSPNAEILRQLDGSYRVSTWRDCVGAIAQLLAGFATIDRLGRLRIVQFGETPCVTLSKNARTNAKISDFSCHYAALVIETDTDTFTSDIEGESGLEMTISDMPLAESGTAEVRQGICDAVFARLRALDYTPAAVTMPGDPALEAGRPPGAAHCRCRARNAGDPPGVEVPRRNDAERRGQKPLPGGRCHPHRRPAAQPAKAGRREQNHLLQLHQRLRHKSEGQRQGDQRRELDFCYHAGYLGHVFGAGAADGRTRCRGGEAACNRRYGV